MLFPSPRREGRKKLSQFKEAAALTQGRLVPLRVRQVLHYHAPSAR
jgi:hypothetical protein